MDMNAVRISLPGRIVARGWRNRIIVAARACAEPGSKKGEEHALYESPDPLRRHSHIAQELTDAIRSVD